MITWTLILLLYTNSNTLITSEGFSSESQCADAGNKLLQAHKTSPQAGRAEINFVCVKKGKL
jgi:uncharacterized protein YegP (UPF0339 family)